MAVQTAYYGVIAFLLLLGYLLCFSILDLYTNRRITLSRHRFQRIKSTLYSRMNDPLLDHNFARFGAKPPRVVYQALRLMVLLATAAIMLWSSEPGRISWLQSFYLLLFVLLTEPRTHWFGMKTPFAKLMDVLVEHYRVRQNREVYQAISQLKNLASVTQKQAPGSLFILEQLSKFSRLTRPVFNQTLLLWQSNDKEEACQYFKQEIGTKEGEHLANLLVKLDELKPGDLRSQLVLFQEELKKRRETEKMKSNQRKAYLIYGFVVTSAFLIIVNFMTVCFFIEFLFQTSFIS